jgi:bifunctional non-homologous end joining protein LigD
LIAKRADSTYRPGQRSKDWLKFKCVREQELVIGGWTDPTGSRTGFGALLLGYYEHDQLRYASKVGTGFDRRALARLLARFATMGQARSPFVDPVAERGAHWVRPELVAQVGFAEWTPDHRLRHPRYLGLREDKPAAEVVREHPAQETPPSTNDRRARDRNRRRQHQRQRAARWRRAELGRPERGRDRGLGHARRQGNVGVAGRQVALTSLDKVLFPAGADATAVTKRDLVRYYAQIAPHLLPYLWNRPVNLQRFPNGVQRPGFWQKQIPEHAPDWVARWRNPDADVGETERYAVIDSEASLVWMANHAAVELHPWTSRPPRTGEPTWALIDIDPGTDTSFAQVLELAGRYRLQTLIRTPAVARMAPALLVRGRLDKSPEGVLNLVADKLQVLSLTIPVKSRDYR